ncbi:MAG: hypothetical protein KC912_11305 [Proteobacteria bacterium]|nr:hypothetical protein [Pseudomonadota bacterium]
MFLLSALLMLSPASASGFDFTTECNGDGAFTQYVPENAKATVGEIPAGMVDLDVALQTPGGEDVDIQLIASDGTVIVGWPNSVIGSYTDLEGEVCGDYRGVKYCYSGYNGVDGDYGNEWVRIHGLLNDNVTMKAYGYGAGDANVTYSYGNSTCNEVGTGSFSVTVTKGITTNVGTIVADVYNVGVNIEARGEDIDVTLTDGDDQTLIVGWEGRFLNGAAEESIVYKDMAITYSGYNGVGGDYGAEWVRVDSRTTIPLVMGAYGYFSANAPAGTRGLATVDYHWSTGKWDFDGPGTSCSTDTDCEGDLVCKANPNSGGTCHSEAWCLDDDSAAADCADLTNDPSTGRPARGGTWSCADFECSHTADLAQDGESCGALGRLVGVVECDAGLTCVGDRGDDRGGICEPQMCGGIAALQCDGGFYCTGMGDFPDASGECDACPSFVNCMPGPGVIPHALCSTDFRNEVCPDTQVAW